MADETTTTETVKKSSDGMVKITLEKFEELTAKANEPKRVIDNRTFTSTIKTDAQQAADNKTWGAIWMIGGGATFVAGAMQFWTGVKQARDLIKG